MTAIWPVAYDHFDIIVIRVTEELVHLIHRVSGNTLVIDTQDLIAESQSNHRRRRIATYETHENPVVDRVHSNTHLSIRIFAQYQLQRKNYVGSCNFFAQSTRYTRNYKSNFNAFDRQTKVEKLQQKNMTPSTEYLLL